MKKVLDRVLEKTKNIKFAQPDTKETALHWAAMNGDEEVIDILLARGANPKAKSSGVLPGTNPSTPADYARDEGHIEIALKLEGKDPESYRTTLHYFAKKGNSAKVKEMLKKGAKVNEAEKRSLFTPLYYAVHYNHPDTVKVLLEGGADPNKIFHTAGITALRDAVVYKYDEVARILIDAGAKADHTQTNGCGTGLNEFTWATEYKQYKLAKYMIDKKAVTPSTPNVFRNRGRNEDIKLAEYLIEKGFQPTHDDIAQTEYSLKTGNEEDKGALKKLIAIYEKALKGKPVAMKSMKMGASSKKPVSETSQKTFQINDEENPNAQRIDGTLRQIRTE